MPAQPASPARALTRREFLGRLGRGGGAVMSAMLALDLLARDNGGRLALSGRAPATKKRVVILGAGLAGMCAAHELGKLGYDCVVLEARRRTGGRCWSVRGGDRETELGGPEQACRFDSGHFMNPGPTRIPGHHATTIDYCKDFGVELQVFTSVNESAYLHREGFPLVRWREAHADYRGYTAELLAKTVNKGALDRPLSAEDRERLIEFLRADGGLGSALTYGDKGTRLLTPGGHAAERRGYSVPPGAGEQAGEPTLPLDFEMLVKSGFGAEFISYYDYHQQPAMLTPVGGMDRIARAFEVRLQGKIELGAVVTEIRRTPAGGVRAGYTRADGSAAVAAGDYCVCTIPPAVLTRIPADFSAPVAAGIAAVSGAESGKIGLQFKRRFWEDDDAIFGGITRTAQPITQILYPFDGYNSAKGVVIGYYNYGGAAAAFGRMTPADREREALRQGAKIHPQYLEEFENSFSVDWRRTPYSQGAWADWPGDTHERYYKLLNQPDGPIWLCGEGLTHLGAWMAGAFTSAHKVCTEIHRRALA